MRNWKMYVLLIGPWFTFLLFGAKSFRRFLPTGIFSSLLITLISELSKSYTWWKVKKPIIPGLSTDITFVFGLFFTLNLWIFKLTYEKVWLYIISNIFADFLFAYPLSTLAEKFKIYKLVNLKRLQLFCLSLSVAGCNYFFHRFVVEKERKG
ncbi:MULTISPECIES: hypothetical protein [Bacillaceae]|uniref:hypothetical protein n=1 Tax=Bacillaceae TaxID=186817 RepID=UPI001E3AD5D4|nr:MULTISPECIES: hypothetical protein [Bacillaceae]MCE4048193.1 hypothetical protein [Bacillus sp. Au-Bac7]MCM3033368.1 hypothetical protein [Niallia sp. MER 6]MDL0434289.1 hypothetical protein [Niallia sp. SS-2023]UPO89039.1 hypothetical protein L8T27_007780 [Niallia sp. Man26]